MNSAAPLTAILGSKGRLQGGTERCSSQCYQTRYKWRLLLDCTVHIQLYQLEQPCLKALMRLEMFRNLQSVNMTAVDGEDRREFAGSYMRQCIQDRFSADVTPVIELDIPLGHGDTRPLVRHLRMLAFYLCTLLEDSVTKSNDHPTTIHGKIAQAENSHSCTVKAAEKTINLRLGTMDNLFPTQTRAVLVTRTREAMDRIQTTKASFSSLADLSELSQLLLCQDLGSRSGDFQRCRCDPKSCRGGWLVQWRSLYSRNCPGQLQNDEESVRSTRHSQLARQYSQVWQGCLCRGGTHMSFQRRTAMRPRNH